MDYVIKKGDTLYSIAKAYGTTVDNLVADNNIKDRNLIYTGDTLKIRDSINDIENPSDKGISDASKNKYNSWLESDKPEYISKYEAEINEVRKALSNRNFEYDKNKDEQYMDFIHTAENSAERALAEALGLASLRNGGMQTSYALSAGQNAYNEEMARAREKASDFYESAYKKYEDETDNLEDRLRLLTNLQDDEWDMYTDILGSYYDEGEDFFERYNKLSNEEFDRFYAMLKLSE